MPNESIISLSGIALKNVRIKILDTKIELTGPILITHWGMSGPVILKASSKSCDILFRQQILGSESRAHFSFADGFLFARDKRRLICLQLNKTD